MDHDTTDLDQIEQVMSSLTTDDEEQQQQQQQRQQHEYQPRTLQSHNRTRCIYLPMFPTESFGPNNRLLLANVPVTDLTPNEVARRQPGAYSSDALMMMMNNYQYSSTDRFILSEQDAEEMAVRLRVDKSIIIFNAQQLRSTCYTLLAFYEKFRQKLLHDKRNSGPKVPGLNSKQMAILLEFYLQIDVDVFYMKTCSFRGAERQFNVEEEGDLFCGKDKPQGRYTLVACNNLFCPCCHPINHWQKSQPWPIVDFVSSSMHQFVNGYTTYLNCPATCDTTNVIYAMTCPCGHYDYVDSTAESLAYAMTFHRRHGNRIIHEKLTGCSLFPGIARLEPNQREKEMANKMRLYQHSARCPIALRSFLDCNPNYWCFIPMLWHEAHADNIPYVRGISSTSASTSSISSTSNEDPELANLVAMGSINNPRVSHCLDHVPLPPDAYAFSYPQRKQQQLFFEKFIPSPIDQLPYSSVDLYKVAVIAVLPDDRSIILRYIIETLFIIHGETKLNMICPIGGDPEKRYGRPYDLIWCANLNCPFVATKISTQ